MVDRMCIMVNMRFIAALLLCLTCIAQDKAHDAILQKDGIRNALLYDQAIKANIRPEMRKELAPIVAAIRYAENGRPGIEYGCLSKYAKDRGYRRQAGECACTVQKNYDRWIKAGKHGKFIHFLGRRYCPVGAENDPQGLNVHWIRNVTKFVSRFK